MPKRNLRIVWRGPKLLASGICEYCNAQFCADETDVAEAQLSVQEQFDRHQCRRQNTDSGRSSNHEEQC
jgi:hypothetical protein